jgi:molybdate transport system ATP-binding protein
MLTTSASHIPDFITHVLSLGNGQEYEIREIAAFKGHAFVNKISSQNDVNILMTSSTQPSFEFAVRMRNVSVQYGGRRILDTVDWEVRNGERWALSGPNGSGKSTLLSLVNADNPQAYANDIYLFDRKRGTGETIWEIKKKIGFLSPELHLYFEKSISCFNTVASGLFDTIGLFRKLTAEQSALVTRWIRVLSLEHVSNKFLFQLSHGQQRLVLLARALVKNPPLLILDEPCQGLDEDQVGFFKDAINKICLAGNKTLIYVSHYPEEIPYCVTRFIRLENGKVTYG